MKKLYLSIIAGLILAGCSAPPADAPETAVTPKAMSETASPSPEETANATPAPSTDLTTNQGIKALQTLIDEQVTQAVLTSAEATEGEEKILVWSGAQGVRRIDFESSKEKGQFYFQEGQLFSFGASGARVEGEQEVEFTQWAGIAPDGTLVGPPFEFVGGKSGPFEEERVREREARGRELLEKHKP